MTDHSKPTRVFTLDPQSAYRAPHSQTDRHSQRSFTWVAKLRRPLYGLTLALLCAGCPDPLPDVPSDDMAVAGDPAGEIVEGGGEAGSFAGSFAPDLGVDMGGGEPEAGSESVPEALCQLCGEDGSPCPEGLSCFTHQESDEDFCSVTCESDDECPSEYECAEVAPEGASGEEAEEEAGEGVGGEAGEETSDPTLVRVCVPSAGRCVPELCRDEDGDGYGRGPDCLGLDCDEDNPEIHEGVEADLCDGVDNDCDGLFDESFTPEACGEGVCAGMSVCEEGRTRCDGPEASGEDANCDALDNDCDGSTDEGYQPLSCGLGACAQPSVCEAGVELCAGSEPPAGDTDLLCDRVDSDCDGVIDEGFVVESSVCGLGVCATRGLCTDDGEVCTPGPELGPDDDCNGLDDDCDGSVDEGFTSPISCGFGACRAAQTCVDGAPICIEGAPNNADDADCNGVDDNCDGIIDNRCAANEFSFQLISESDEHLEVGIVFSRGAETELNTATLPYLLELRFSHPAGLTSPTFTSGAVLADAGFVFPVTDRDSSNPTQVRLLLPPGIPPIEYEYMSPGELVRVRFTKAAGATAPFSLNWIQPEPYTDENGNGRYDFGEPYTDVNSDQQRNANTSLTPIEADAIILLTDAQLGGQ